MRKRQETTPRQIPYKQCCFLIITAYNAIRRTIHRRIDIMDITDPFDTARPSVMHAHGAQAASTSRDSPLPTILSRHGKCVRRPRVSDRLSSPHSELIEPIHTSIGSPPARVRSTH